MRGIAGTEFDPKTVAEYEKWYGKFSGISITPEVARGIGQGYGTIIQRSGGKKVVIGFEKRPYAEELTEAFIQGVLASGTDVAFAGISLTPMVYFAVPHFKFDGGVNVTGSHNIYFFNGFKMMKKDVYPLYGDELQELRQIVEKEDFVTGNGTRSNIDIFSEYLKYIVSRFKLNSPIKVVTDCGNGSAGMFAPRLLKELGCDLISELYSEPDATFPNHVPDPEMPQNMEDLMEEVKKTGADVGIAFDADGDRVGFVDETGTFLDGDETLLVMSRDILKQHTGKKILFDVKCTQLLEELVPQFGGVPLMYRTGHAPIKEALRLDADIILGGEISGHFYHVADYYKIDDGLYTAALMLKLLEKTKKPVSALYDFPERIRTPEIKLPCDDAQKFSLVNEIVGEIKKSYRTIELDGARFYLSDTAWGLIRPSNTSPYLTIRVEAKTTQEVLKIKNILADLLEKYPAVGDKLNRHEVASMTGRLGWV